MKRRLRSARKQERPVASSHDEALSAVVVKRIDFEESFLSEKEDDHQKLSDVISTLETLPEETFRIPPLPNKLTGVLQKNLLNQEKVQVILANTSGKSQTSSDLSKSLHIIGSPYNTEEESFVPAEEFFSQRRTKESLSGDFVCSSDTTSKLRESTERLKVAKSFNPYISYSSDEELEDWWRQPKTDYTYSTSLSYRERVTPDRRIGSPNMSRRGLKGAQTGTLESPPFSQVIDAPHDSLSLRSRRIPRGGLGALSDDSDVEEESRSEVRTFSGQRRSVGEARSFRGLRTATTTAVTSNSLKYGLDGTTDSENEKDSPALNLARPIVRRGAATFAGSLGSSNNETKSSINGTIYGTRTYSVTSTRLQGTENQAVIGRYRNYFYERAANRMQYFVDQILKQSTHVWTKTIEYSTTTLFTLRHWLTELSSKGSHILRTSKTPPPRKTTTTVTTTTVTTTTVMSRKQRVYRLFEDVGTWYGKKRRQSPCVWAWLPLLLLLVLLLLFIPWLVSPNEQNVQGGKITSQSQSQGATWSLYSMLPYRISWDSSFLWEKFTGACATISQVFRYSLAIIWDFLVVILSAIHYAFALVYDRICLFFAHVPNFISTIFVAEKRAEQENQQTIEIDQQKKWEYWNAYSPGPMIYSGWATTLDKMSQLGVTTWGFLNNFVNYSTSALVHTVVWLFWLFSSLWHGIISIFSFVLVSLASFFGFLSASFSALYSKKPPLDIDPAAEYRPDETFHKPFDIKLNTEDIVEKVLKSSAFQFVISSNVKEHLDVKVNAELKQTLAAEMKDNMDLELKRLHAEYITLAAASASSKEEALQSVKEQQEELVIRLQELELALARALATQRAESEDVAAYKEKLEAVMSDIKISLEKLNERFGLLQSDHESLAVKVASCCKNGSLTVEQVEQHVLTLLSDLLNLGPEDEDEADKAKRMHAWFNAYFASKNEMDQKLNLLWEKDVQSVKGSDSKLAEETLRQTADIVMGSVLETLRTEIEAQHKQSLEKVLHYVNRSVSEKVAVVTKNYENIALNYQGTRNSTAGIDAAAVNKIVKDALLKYDADKTGMVDHALESGGGSVVSTRCTEGYQGHQAELTIFGYSFYRYSTNTPRSLIQPDRNPGQCYAFKGSQGFIVIQFAGPVRVVSFTYEHIPKVLTPSGSIDSAPREFSVHGLQTTEEEGFHFGNFVYSDQGEPMQFFPAHNVSDDYFKFVELKIHSNHGNMHYTCIYRFRVHGVRKL